MDNLDTHRIGSFLTRNNQPNTFIDVEKDEGAGALLEALGVRVGETPINRPYQKQGSPGDFPGFSGQFPCFR